MVSYLLLLGIGIAGSIFFSGAETGFITWNVLKVKHRAAAGDIAARWGLFLIQQREQLISAILIGNNIANIGTSLAFAAVIKTLLPSLPAVFSKIPSPEAWVLTPLLLLLGEMLPKSLFRIYPFRLTVRATPLMMVFFLLTYPVTRFFSLLTKMVKQNRHGINSSYSALVREEMVLIASEGSKTGSLFRSADQFMEGVLLLDEKKIGDLIAKCALNASVFNDSDTVETVKKNCAKSTSVILVRGENGQSTGFIPIIDIALAPDTSKLRLLQKSIHALPENSSVLAAIRIMKRYTGGVFSVEGEDGTSRGITDISGVMSSAFDNFQLPVYK